MDGILRQAWGSDGSLERIDAQDDLPPPLSGPGEGFGAAKADKKQENFIPSESSSAIRPTYFTIDLDTMLCSKSKVHPALLSYQGHALMEHRHGLIL